MSASATTPLLFLLVSVYFENRIEFYDLIIKRGVIMLLSLVVLAGVLAFNFGWIELLPRGAARPWLFAVLLLPVAMFLPWLHDRVGRLLDRLWFGREFTPVEAVKHVLGAMQQATDEPSLVAATESTLREMFRRRVRHPVRGSGAARSAAIATDIRTAGSAERSAAGRRRTSRARGRCSARISRCCARSAASSASCSRTSGCSASGRSRSRSRRSCACRRADRSSRRCGRRSIRTSCSTP